MPNPVRFAFFDYAAEVFSPVKAGSGTSNNSRKLSAKPHLYSTLCPSTLRRIGSPLTPCRTSHRLRGFRPSFAGLAARIAQAKRARLK